MVPCFEWFTTWIKLVEASHLQGVKDGVIYYKESSYDIVTNEFVKFKKEELSKLISHKIEIQANKNAVELLEKPAVYALSKYNVLSERNLKEIPLDKGVIYCKLPANEELSKVLIVNIENCTRNVIVAAFSYIASLVEKSRTSNIDCVEGKKICPIRDCPTLLPQLLLESEEEFKEKSLIVYDRKKERLVFSDDGTPFLNDRMAEAYYIFVLLYPGVSFIKLREQRYQQILLNIYNNIKKNSDPESLRTTIKKFVGMYDENKIGDSSFYFSAKSRIRSSIKKHLKDKDVVYQNVILKQYEINDDNEVLGAGKVLFIPYDID